MRHLDVFGFPQERPAAVAAYSPIVGEPDIRGLLNRLFAVGVDVYLPVSTPNQPLEWALDDGRYRASTVGGGLEPVGPTMSSDALLGVAGLVIVPALAVDVRGVRLGQGGGFYDRSFTALRLSLGTDCCAFWAAVYDDEVLPAGRVPAEPHDLRVDAALTPSGLTPTRTRSRG